MFSWWLWMKQLLLHSHKSIIKALMKQQRVTPLCHNAGFRWPFLVRGLPVSPQRSRSMGHNISLKFTASLTQTLSLKPLLKGPISPPSPLSLLASACFWHRSHSFTFFLLFFFFFSPFLHNFCLLSFLLSMSCQRFFLQHLSPLPPSLSQNSLPEENGIHSSWAAPCIPHLLCPTSLLGILSSSAPSLPSCICISFREFSYFLKAIYNLGRPKRKWMFGHPSSISKRKETS